MRLKGILYVNDAAETTAVIKMGLIRHGFEVEALFIQNRHYGISKPVCMI